MVSLRLILAQRPMPVALYGCPHKRENHNRPTSRGHTEANGQYHGAKQYAPGNTGKDQCTKGGGVGGCSGKRKDLGCRGTRMEGMERQLGAGKRKEKSEVAGTLGRDAGEAPRPGIEEEAAQHRDPCLPTSHKPTPVERNDIPRKSLRWGFGWVNGCERVGSWTRSSHPRFRISHQGVGTLPGNQGSERSMAGRGMLVPREP